MWAVNLLSLIFLLTTPIAPPRAASPIVGTWRLVSFESRDEAGRITLAMGSDPIGQLVYDAGDNVSVHLMAVHRKPFVSGDRLSGSDQEVRVAFEGYHAYFGRYSVDERAHSVTHYIEGASFPNLIGSNQVRKFEVVGDRLTLSTPPIRVGARFVTSVLVWERARQVPRR